MSEVNFSGELIRPRNILVSRPGTTVGSFDRLLAGPQKEETVDQPQQQEPSGSLISRILLGNPSE